MQFFFYETAGTCKNCGLMKKREKQPCGVLAMLMPLDLWFPF